MAIFAGPEIVNSGLVLNLDAANSRSYPGSGTTWFDVSGNRNNSTLVNGGGYNSSNNGSLVFDGVDDYIDTGKTAAQFGIYDSPYTMCAFFKVPNLTGDKMVFGTTTAGTRIGLHHGVRNNTFYFGHYAADAVGGTVIANTWYFGTWIWDTTAPNARIYINGNLVGSSNAASFLGTTNILIGRAFNSYFSANIANASIYNRVLPLLEIKQNFEATRDRYGI